MRRPYFILSLFCILLTLTVLTPQSALAEGEPTPEPVLPPWITGQNTEVSTGSMPESEAKPSGVVVDSPSLVGLAPQENQAAVDELVQLAVPQRYQNPADPTCGAAALGMALEFLSLTEGGEAPDTATLVQDLDTSGLLYDTGTGVEELAYLARAYGYRGANPFHGWTLESLAGELAAGHPVVVSLGLNGENQPGHFVTLTGMAADGSWVTYNDPVLGEQTLSAEEFLATWSSQGYSGLTVNKNAVAAATDPLLPWIGLLGAMSTLTMLVKSYPVGQELRDLLDGLRGMLSKPDRPGLGGRIDGPGSGGGGNLVRVPIYETQLVRKGNKTIEVEEKVYATQRIPVGSHQETYTAPKYETIQVQVGTRPVSKTVPNYVWKNIQVGYKQVTEQVKVTKYRNETYRVWGKKTTKVPVYKNVKYVRYYKYKSVKKTKWVRQGWRLVKKTYYTTKKVPVYGTKKKFTGYKTKTSWGWQTKTRKVPYTDYKTVTRTVPDYKRMRVQQGTKTITEEIPVYQNKKIQVGYETKTRTVTDYREYKYPVGTKTVTKTMPNFEEEQVVVGYKYLPVSSNAITENIGENASKENYQTVSLQEPNEQTSFESNISQGGGSTSVEQLIRSEATRYTGAYMGSLAGYTYNKIIKSVLPYINKPTFNINSVGGFVHEDLWAFNYNSNPFKVLTEGEAWLYAARNHGGMDGGITNLLTNETKYVQLKSVNPTLPSAADTTSKYGRLASTYSNNQTLLVTEEVVDDIAAKTTNPASVGSSGVSNAEVLSATELARKSLNGSALSSLKLSMKLANQAAIKAGGVAAIVSGGISAIDNAIALSNDEINLATAVADTTVDTTGGIVSAMAGAWAGAMAGAAVGTIVPGAGNVIGAAAGFLVGLAVGMGAQAVWDKHVQEPAVEFLSEGLGAYEGVAENAKIIGEVALERATEAVTSTAEKAKETISTAVEGATSAVAGFVGNLFGGG